MQKRRSIALLIIAIGAPHTAVEAAAEPTASPADGVELVRLARQFRDERKPEDCGRTFLRAADGEADPSYRADLLFEAGACFRQAGAFGRAIAAYERVVGDPPYADKVTEARYEIALLRAQTADYEQAADLLEAVARKDHWRSERTLRKAVSLRMALRQYDKVIADIVGIEGRLVYPSVTLHDGSVWWSLGQRRVRWDPSDHPSLTFSLAEAYERQGRTTEVVDLLNRFVRRAGPGRDPHALVRAHFKLGEIAWRQSCPTGGTDGGCVSVERVPVPPRDLIFADQRQRLEGTRPFSRPPGRYCPVLERWVTKPIRRNRGLAAAAQRHFARALELWGSDSWDFQALLRARLGSTDEIEAEEEARFAAAGAAFYRAEQRYEEYLRISLPPKLYLMPPPGAVDHHLWNRRIAASERALLSYMKRKANGLAALVGPSPDRRGAYDLVVDYGSAHWAMAATARMAQAVTEAALQIQGIPIPEGTPEQDEWGNRTRDLLCKSIRELAAPFDDEAVAHLARCVQAGDRLMLSNDWTNLCQEKLGQMRRLERMSCLEILPEPSITAPSLWTSGPPLSRLLPEGEDEVPTTRR